MKNDSRKFNHESLQDAVTIGSLLASLKQGIEKGEIAFADEQGAITLKPDGLMNLKITASRNDGFNLLDIRVSWHSHEPNKYRKKLKVSTG